MLINYSVALVLLLHPLVHPLKLPFSLAVLDLLYIKVLGTRLKQPLRRNLCDGPDVILGSEYELIVYAPLWFVIYAR